MNGNNRLVKRWDSAPHHKEISSFPFHLHTPEGVRECDKVNLIEAIDIILMNKEYYLKSHKGELEGDMMRDKELGEMLMADETFLGISELKFGYNKHDTHASFFNRWKILRYYNETLSELQDHVDFLFPEGVTSHGELYMLRGQTSAKGINPVIELLFEYVRRSLFPSCPSHFQSVFAFENIAQAVNLAIYYYIKRKKRNCKAYNSDFRLLI